MTPALERPALRVAMVGAYPEDPSVIRNGVEAVMLYLVESLRSLPGIHIHVVTTSEAIRTGITVERDGVALHRVPSARRLRNVTFDTLNRGRVRAVLADLQPDLVHVHNHLASPYLGPNPPPWPVVTTVHGLMFEEAKYERGLTGRGRWLPRRVLERLAFRASSELIAVSDYVRRAIADLTRANITVLENPVAEAFFEAGEARCREQATTAPPRILFAGAIMRRKNVLGLLRAVTLVRPHSPDIELRLAGGVQDPAYHHLLRRYVHENALQANVRFLGQLSESELLTEYSRCVLVASASHEETAGMVFQQGMAAGVPILGTAVGGVPFIVAHEETGILARAGDVGELAAGLGALLRDPALRARLGAAGRRVAVERFAPSVVARKTLGLYERILRSRRMERRDGA